MDASTLPPTSDAQADAPAMPATATGVVLDPAPTEREPYTLTETCLLTLTVLAALAFMRWTEAFVVPLLVAILISYTLAPTVQALERLHLPRAIGAALMLGAVGAASGALVYSLSDDVVALSERVPEAAARLRALARHQNRHGTAPLANLQRAATELEKAAAEAAGVPAPSRAAPGASPGQGTTSRLQRWLFDRTSVAVQVLVQLGTAMLVAFFLLTAGDTFRRKVARIAGPTLARRRLAITMLNDIHARIQRYMGTIVLSNILIALATWGALAAIGLEHALFWGVVAGLLHLIPYVGSSIAATAVGIVALAQFGEPLHALAAAGGVVGIAVLIGLVFTTWLQARTCRVNSVAVIAGMLFFGWLWGGWGLLLAVPVLTVLSTVSEGIVQWRPLAELLAE